MKNNQEITYSFTIYFSNGDKHHTDMVSLEEARKELKRVKEFKEEFSITKWVGYEGDEVSESFFNKEAI